MNLQYFNTGNLFDAGKQLFDTLQIPLNTNTSEPIDYKQILGERYKPETHDIFEAINEVYFFGKVDNEVFADNENKVYLQEAIENDREGIIILGIDLNWQSERLPSRSKLAQLTRVFNQAIKQGVPVIMLFRYKHYISLATTERTEYKQEWRQGEKIGKVAILKDINTKKPHRAHFDILQELSVWKGEQKALFSIATYEQLYQHWRNTFDVDKLNKDFYKEIFYWYLWAKRTIDFYKIVNKEEQKKIDKDVFHSETVIRLLTRLIFSWFVKEKQLIPEELFNAEYLKNRIKNFDKNSENSSEYYLAILQNLFFATLNTEMPKDGGERTFINDKKGYSDQYLDHLSYRHKNLFDKPAEALKLFENVPFLNGGLFECLDRREDNTEYRYDGFSTKKIKQPHFPNFLFFGNAVGEDFSTEIEKKKQYKNIDVSGIINILNRYKFTIEENTPLEQEVALDPELLGKIFENLLASYSPETGSTARKQMGAYYTPREIVNYMVDESLIAYLKTKIEENKNLEGLEDKIRQLFSYETDENPFANQAEINEAIIGYLSDAKILDPACGSGAFPMGVLHQIVHVLGKVDPNNQSWKKTQLQKAERDLKRANEFEDDKIREQAVKSAEQRIEFVKKSFDNPHHELDYQRKLFLIENSIFGIDKLNIAVQISKLRFFISLMVEQQVIDSEKNRNILSLPNLETKFVAADTLIALDKPNILKSPELIKAEKELEDVRHRIFYTRSYSQKKKLKRQEAEKRKNLKTELKKSGYSEVAATKMTEWSPFNNMISAPFFDSQTMFGFDTGFDVVIGNPPYVNTKRGINKNLKKYCINNYKTAIGQFDLFTIFIEKGLNIGNLLSFIVPKPFINNQNYEIARKIVAKNGLKIVITGSGIFENAGVESCIFISSDTHNEDFSIYDYIDNEFVKKNVSNILELNNFPFYMINTEISFLEKDIFKKIANNSIPLSEIINITRGIEGGKSDECITYSKNKYKLLRGGDLKKYETKFNNIYCNFDEYNTSKFKPIDLYFDEKLIIRRVSNEILSCYDNQNYVVLNTIYCCKIKNNKFNLKYISSLLNSELLNYWFKKMFVLTDKLFPYLRVSQISYIPIKNCKKNIQSTLLITVDYILHIKQSETQINEYVNNAQLSAKFEELVDAMVYELYFEESVKQAGCEVIDLVGRLMQPIEGIEDENKIAEIINESYEHLQNSDSELRNRILKQKIAVPEIEIINKSLYNSK